MELPCQRYGEAEGPRGGLSDTALMLKFIYAFSMVRSFRFIAAGVRILTSKAKIYWEKYLYGQYIPEDAYN